MRSLQDFEVTKKVNIFPNAQTLPAFFNSNLLQESRVVKAFRNDPQANIRVFYYQYLKLCFEVSDCDYEQYIRKIEDIINDSNFNFVFDQTDDPSIFNDIQFKQLIMEFFGLLGEGTASIEACINNHPIIDTVFIYFFRSILILTNVTDSLESYIGRTNLFNVLVSHFNVDMEIHENCVRFPQSDIFVYQERPEEVFMAYIDGESDGFAPPSKEYLSYEASEETIEAPIQLKPAVVKIEPTPQVQNLISAKQQANHSNKEGKIQIKESYIEDQFLDYTSNSPALHTLVRQNKLKQSGDIKDPKYRAKNPQPIVPPFQEKPKSKNYQFTAKEEAHQKNQPPQNLNAKKQQKKSSESQYNQMLNATDNTHNNILGKKVDNFYNKSLESAYKINGQQSANDPALGSKIITNYPQSNYYPDTQKINSSSVVAPLQYNNTTIQGSAPIQAEKKNQSNNFTNFTQLNGFNAVDPNYNSNVGISNAIQQNNVQKPDSSYYNPGFNSLQKFGSKKPAPYDPNIQSSFEAKKPNFFDPANSTSQASNVLKLSSFGKNPCGLNVSDEFTNSFTMKMMNEPYRSNVTGIRQRARNFRNSLKTFIK